MWNRFVINNAAHTPVTQFFIKSKRTLLRTKLDGPCSVFLGSLLQAQDDLGSAVPSPEGGKNGDAANGKDTFCFRGKCAASRSRNLLQP